MGVLSVFLLVLFIIVSILLILLVLVQSEDGDSLGGVFAGGSSSAFGSRSGNILTRASSVLGVLFFVLSFSLAMLNRTPNDNLGVERAGRQSISQDAEETLDLKAFEPTGQVNQAGVETPDGGTEETVPAQNTPNSTEAD